MTYLLDANVFISGHQRHYRFSFVPGFWHWLAAKHEAGLLLSSVEVGRELIAREDALSAWVKANNSLFRSQASRFLSSLAAVAEWASASNRTMRAKDTFLDSVDFKLIALAHAEKFTLVTEERPQPSQTGKIKIPDVCNDLGIAWISPWDFFESVGADFSTPRS